MNLLFNKKPIFTLYKSDKPAKKYKVEFINPSSNIKNKLYFGASGYTDYILSGGDQYTKWKYINRHVKREDWTDPYKAGTWSRYILWNEPTLKDSIKSMQKLFNIKIINKTQSK